MSSAVGHTPRVECHPGAEFALAYARDGLGATLELRHSLTTLFPAAPHRVRPTVRDLLKVLDVADDTFTYAREVPGEIVAGYWSGQAPELGFRFTAEAARIGRVRAYVRVPAELLNDPVVFAQFIDYRLIVRIYTSVNNALLNGHGEIQGILNTPGVRQHPARATLAATLVSACSACEKMGGSVDGMVMSIGDWWRLAGSGSLLSDLRAMGIRICRTRMIPPGLVLVGDFEAGGTVLDQRRSTIRFAAEDDPEFRSGEITVVGEVAEGLAVHLPAHFVLASVPSEE